MSFVALTIEETNADSALNEPLFTKIKDNFDALNDSDVTGGDAHNHSGGDGATIGTDGVIRTSLKTAIGSVLNGGAAALNLTLPGGAYGFYPQIKMNDATLLPWSAQLCGYPGFNFIGWTSYITNITLKHGSGAGKTIYAQQRYIQASPPYKVGDKKWEHFLYMLVNIQGDVIAAYEAEDPPYAYNGSPHNPKDSIERIMAVPHPFADYHDKDPAIDGLEIVLVDLREHNTKQWKADNAKQGKGILEDLGHINKKGLIFTPQELGIGNIQGFTDKVKIRKHN